MFGKAHGVAALKENLFKPRMDLTFGNRDLMLLLSLKEHKWLLMLT